MPAGCHSKSKSYKQNEEKSLISIYSNEACNNANHKSCSHCYSISVSYPSPHIFRGCLSSSLHSQSPSWPGDTEGTKPTPCGHLGCSHLCHPDPKFEVTTSHSHWLKHQPELGSTWGGGLRTGDAAAPNPDWYLYHLLGSIKREKLSPGLISLLCFNLGARLPVIPPRAELSAAEQRGPIPAPLLCCSAGGTAPPALVNLQCSPSPLLAVAVPNTQQCPHDVPLHGKQQNPALSWAGVTKKCPHQCWGAGGAFPPPISGNALCTHISLQRENYTSIFLGSPRAPGSAPRTQRCGQSGATWFSPTSARW